MTDKKVAFITGATDGIGKATAQRFLSEGWKVIIIGRNQKRCESCVEELKSKTGTEDISAITADLSILADVKNATDNFLQNNSRLDLLMLNANAISNERIVSSEGFEKNFALGYLSRVFMINKLESVLNQTPNSQILAVIGLDTVRPDFDDLTIQNKFTGRKGLGRWQWAMNVFAGEYNKNSKIPLNLYMPGLVRTKILANEPQPMRAFVQLMNLIVGITPEKSAENIFSVVHEIMANNKKGTCYSWKKERALPKPDKQPGDSQKLLHVTENLIQPYL